MSSDEATTYLSAADTVAELIDRIDPAALTGPGLGDWDLRALIGHTGRALVTVITYFDQPADGEDVASPEDYFALVSKVQVDPAAIAERGRQAGAALGDDPAGAFRALVEQARAKVAATDPHALIGTIAGGMQVRAYLPTRTFELVVHGLDVAAAAGLSVEFAPEVLAEASQLAARICVVTGQAPALLAALTGRSALPAGFTLVP
ncbi:MAG TPA: maleylpyruvate isomerase N-terminal domain-containing protein [Sporichthyaceae bacterium]